MKSPSFWLRCLPAGLRAKIEHRPNLQKILGNTGWLFADKILRMGMGLLVGVWVARYLGPEQFGLFNYATAIVALFTSIATLGLNNIVIRDLVKNPEDASATLGTAFLLQLIGGGLAAVAATIAVTLMRPEDTAARIMVVIFGSAMMLKASDVIRYWFEARVQSKYTVLVENAAFLVFAAVKVALILTAAPLQAFVWVVLAETALVTALLLVIYAQQGNRLGNWRYQYARAKNLLHDSWPLILSGLAAMLYMRIDQIMLGQILNNNAVGVFSAATRISEVWYFVPTAIASSVFPSIIESKKISEEIYYSRLKKLFRAMFVLSFTLACITTILSDQIIKILYGNEFAESAKILVIHIWAGIFVFSGIASSQWFLMEKLQIYSLYRTLAGAAINIALNFILIPIYGAIGAAVATVISQGVASVFFNAINKKTRRIFLMQINAFNIFSYAKYKLRTK